MISRISAGYQGYQPDIRGYQPDSKNISWIARISSGYQRISAGYQGYQPDSKNISWIARISAGYQGYQPDIGGYQPDIKAACTPDIRSYYPLKHSISSIDGANIYRIHFVLFCLSLSVPTL